MFDAELIVTAAKSNITILRLVKSFSGYHRHYGLKG